MKNITKSSLIVLAILFSSSLVFGQSITGLWKTVDDETGNAVSHVEITEVNGKFYGKVIKLLPAATVRTCDKCTGEDQGRPIEGMQILWDMEPYKDYWSYGKIMDPKKASTYKCSIWLEGDILKVRGYLGVSLIGRTQEWYRVK